MSILTRPAKVRKPARVARKSSSSRMATKRAAVAKTTTTTMPTFSTTRKISGYQKRVYDLLLQIPPGKITSYASLAKALDSSPRAIGGAMRNNPFAPDVPCHRCIASTGYIGGFKGDWEKAPSGINCEKKLELLKGEGVRFDGNGMLVDKSQWWSDFKV